MGFAEVKSGGADEVADVFDEQDAVLQGGQVLQGVADCVGVEVAAFAGVDLPGSYASGGDAGGVDSALLQLKIADLGTPPAPAPATAMLPGAAAPPAVAPPSGAPPNKAKP